MEENKKGRKICQRHRRRESGQLGEESKSVIHLLQNWYRKPPKLVKQTR